LEVCDGVGLGLIPGVEEVLGVPPGPIVPPAGVPDVPPIVGLVVVLVVPVVPVVLVPVGALPVLPPLGALWP
jgi:hypothetical protein